MSMIPDGGTPTTTLVTVTTSPTLLAPLRNGGGNGRRSSIAIQVVGTATVYVGGADVGSGGTATQGLTFFGVPSPQTDPPTQPKAVSLGTTVAALYAIVASGTGSVVVYEELISGG